MDLKVNKMEPIDNVLSRLDHRQSGKTQWDARCPCRADDENPSLRVSVGKQGQVLLYCQRGGGCDANDICESIGLTTKDLFPASSKKVKKNKPLGKPQETYKYLDTAGELVMEVLRYVDEDGKKTFRQRKPNGHGGWDWSTSGMAKPLYRLPQVLNAIKEGKPVYVVEGEKDVHSLEAIGKVATTNPGGAGGEGQNKWTEEHTQSLAGANVIIICDNDESGYRHARHVHNVLQDVANSVRAFMPKEHNDISDLLQAGGKIPDDLLTLDVDKVTESTMSVSNTGVQSIISGFKQMSDSELDEGMLVNWKEFLEAEMDLSYDWVIPDLLERGERVIVVAAEGAGKTTLMRQVALMSSAGIHPFKRTAMKPIKTLTVDLENPPKIIRRHGDKIYQKIKYYDMHHNLDQNSHLLSKPDGIDMLKDSGKEWLEEYVDMIRPDILFFGPLYKAFLETGNRSAESVSIEIAKFFDYIKMKYNCALWLEHHAPLGSGGQRDLRPFGSAVWSRWSEFGLALAPSPEDPELIEFRHYRGQREARQWPAICQRGTSWPFEVVEYLAYESPEDTSKEDENEDFSEEFDDGDTQWA
jgi:5S rRNA maturation endonuclease (ribonuclease M5)